MSEELKPCAFCGGEAEIKNNYLETHGIIRYDEYYVACMECFAQTHTKATEAEAITAWNTRFQAEPRALTWKELSNKMGEPIYLVIKESDKLWDIFHMAGGNDIDKSGYDNIDFAFSGCLSKLNYGETWTAYAKSLKED